MATAEILIDGKLAQRGLRMLTAMAACAPPGSAVSERYTGRHDLLMLYGYGLPSRMEAGRRHLAAGGRLVIWDMGYWSREDHMRIAIDSFHPTGEQLAMAPEGQSRPTPPLREDADPTGPVMLVGMSHKSAEVMLGIGALNWERKALARIRKAYPGRPVVWRPKGRAYVDIPGTTTSPHTVPIHEALRGCSLVVCRHSNVAVDACAAGIPVQCEDGAARSLYAHNESPSRADRAEFLRRLSWWNWSPAESGQAWQWIRRVTGR